MKKIINGKVYDTETAINLGSWENFWDARDIDYVKETLFRKRTNEFFLHGEGGARSYYATIDTDRMIGGEAILPMSYESARQWAEDHLSTEEYEAIFGAIEEDDTRKNLTLSLPTDLIEKIKREAAAANLSLSAYAEFKLKM